MTDGVADTVYRRARAEDIVQTSGVFLAATNELYARRAIPLLEGERGERSPLHWHWLAQDAERFWVAERGGRVVGFSAGIVRPGARGPWWFLGALFVMPEAQGQGVGRGLLERAVAGYPARGGSIATVADALQPVSVTLYARLGMLPRLPLVVFGGRPSQSPGAWSRTVRAVGTARTLERLREIDLAVTGVDRTVDHRFLQAGGRELWLAPAEERGRSLDPGRICGYIYVSTAGVIGPGAGMRPVDTAHLARHALARAAELGADGVSAIVPGANARAQRVFWDAGLSADAAMGVLLASRGLAGCDRYLVGSFGLL